MTPVALQLLLHTYCVPHAYPDDSPAVVEAKIYLSSNGLIDYVRDGAGAIMGDGAIDITERGRAHVKALLLIPLPHQCWVTHGSTLYHNIE